MKLFSIYSFFLLLILNWIGNTSYNNSNKVQYALNENDISFDWIEQTIDSALTANDISGLSIAIIQNGQTTFLKGFGTKKRGSNEKIDENSIFQIGSTTKMLTGTIVNNLINEGKIDLESFLVNYLPNSLDHKTKERLKEIRIKDLLHHRSGISTWGLNNGRIDGDPMVGGYSQQNLLQGLEELKLEFNPGTQFSYSNSGYAILGYTCEIVSGESYATLVKKYIAERYNLNHTKVNLDSDEKKLMATPYRKDNRTVETKAWDMGKLTPAGGIYSTVADLSKLMTQQIKSYNAFYKDGLFHPLVLTKYTTSFYSGRYYGFGLMFNTLKEDLKYEHGGDLDGFACEYAFSANKKSGVIILTTSGGLWVHELQEKIYSKII